MEKLKDQMLSFGRRTFMLSILYVLSQSLWAQHYWVGGSGEWSDHANHWATTSGGNTFHTEEPTSTSDVIFDVNSFTETGQIVTIDISEANCKSMDWSGVSNNPAFDGKTKGNVLNVYGSLTLSADMTCNLAFVEMESDESGNTITTSGTHLGPNAYLRFFGDGSWDLQDVLGVKVIQFLSGTLNTNNNTLNIEQSFLPSGSKSKTFNAGSSIINTGQWRLSGSNHTFNMGTSTIVTRSFYGDQDDSGSVNYYNLEIRGGGSINDNSNFNKLTLDNGGNVVNNIRIESGTTVTFNELEIVSDKTSPLEIYASEFGSEAIFHKNSGTVDVSYVMLRDIHATGGASFNANPGVDNGNSDGWAFLPMGSLDYYWVGDGGDWSDYATHWATESGGTEFHTEVPSLFDAVYFDSNSFTKEDQRVEVDSTFRCASIDFTGVEHLPYINGRYENRLTVYGSVKFNDQMEGVVYNLNLNGVGKDNVINLGGVRVQNFYIYGYSDWELMSDVTVSHFGVYDGSSLNTNGYDITSSYSINFYGSDITLDLDSSRLSTRDFSLRYVETNVNFGTSEITVNRNFIGDGFHYYKVIMAENATLLDENTFEYLEIVPGTDAKFESNLIQTVNQELKLHGTPGQPINISSTTPGTQASVSLSSGTVNGSWMILQDINATGGATYNALESVDNGNNTGWNITAAVPLDYYWVGGTGDWSDFASHWATSSGGSTFRTREPASMDNVYFDANSFTAEDQTVTIDMDEVTFNDMSWEGAGYSPTLYGNDKTLNIYGSLSFIPEMKVYIRDFRFFSDKEENITPGSSFFPGTNSYCHFLGTGIWNLTDSLTVRELNIHSGTFNTLDNWMHVDYKLSFQGLGVKTLNLGNSTLFARSFGWSGIGDSLTINGRGSHIMFSSTFEPESFNDEGTNIALGNLSIVKSRFSDNARLNSSISVDTLRIEAGKSVQIYSNAIVTVNQLIAEGTMENPISISCVQEGTQGSIQQTDGTVDGYFLELKDINATGGATFNAYTSLDLGNVSGWTFFKESQSIYFSTISDKSVTDNSFELSATSSSGLQVSFEILSGPATVSDNIITLTGDTGMVQILATQLGDERYFQAQSVKQSFHVASVTGLNELNYEVLKVWPNPAQDVLYLKTSAEESIQNITILDLNGRTILSSRTPEKMVNVQHLKNGFYVILIKTSKVQYQGRFVINK